jgi:Sec-independent protein translocase protein TatA
VGVELLLGLALGFVILGPKRMQTMLGHLGRAKASLEKAQRNIKSQLAADLRSEPPLDGRVTDNGAVTQPQ